MRGPMIRLAGRGYRVPSMHRTAIVFLLVLGAFAFVAAGCGGGEEATPTPETVEGTVPADTGTAETGADTDTGEMDTGETDTGETGTGGGDDGEGDPAAGEEVFASAGCGGCHVLQAAGASGSVGPNLDETKPDYELAVDRVTNGAGAMPAFKDQLDEQQIKDVSAYVAENAGS